MGEFGAAGEVIGGGLLAGAVEPVGDGKGGEKIPGPGECLNCATVLAGEFCHHCGQKVHIHRTLAGLFHDFVHGILHLDGKFWRTLPMLVWKPGELTRRYIRGQRARFISPIAIYLFTVVAMFAFVISIGEINPGDIKTTANVATSVEEQEKVVANLEQALAELEAEQFPGVGAARSGVAVDLDRAKKHLAELKGEKPVETGNGGVQLSFGNSSIDFLNDQIQKAQENPTLYFYKVQTKAYKLSWLLIPLSLPFMWLLFPFSRKYKLYDHAVFVTYSIAFMMLLVLTVAGTGAIFGGAGWLAFAALIPPIHMYRQLRGAYELGRASAMLRTFLLITMSIVVLALFISLMLILGVF